MRALSNRSMAEVEDELAKCILLCANCHAEEHNPGMATTNRGSRKDNGRISGR